ncbi:MAG: cytochrome c maturation protein CcmE [Saprospiraceae bacterium]|jgi:cytochrome c-type biogenesis protein CcmE|nr:cytochrome c maturation protein CcmE [Saprospiraceae bacterium]MBK7794765.1 cytochrome c maturation protein CcmE [Saprospiraceae bacterium]MBK8153207.1 cytochrome c maturation protein CcmE [Saprospiraceae bacterium]MBL0261420.1 cytochrome c maturation protein CcmE [Saprospiraceae bacterium]HMS29632.1 cytochrome c maturation protein CcmE [Saprospiraceae bacterium]
MQKTWIIAIVMICAAIALLVNASADLTKYAGFEDAKKDQNIVKIAGTLRKDKEMNYDPEINPNLFSFYLKDVNGVTEKVNLHAAKPQDFELSEQVVVTGKFENEAFEANEILLKCPSKYNDEEKMIKALSK